MFQELLNLSHKDFTSVFCVVSSAFWCIEEKYAKSLLASFPNAIIAKSLRLSGNRVGIAFIE